MTARAIQVAFLQFRATVLVAVIASFTIAEEPEAAKATAKKASLDRIVADLEGFEFSAATKPPEKLALSGEPVLRWNYPIRNVDDAALFVLLGKDRPEVVATVMSYRDGNGNLRRAYEFLSISQNPLEAQNKGAQVWHPEKPGFAWRSLPNAPVPAGTLAARKRQMHDLASKFQVAVRSDVSGDLKAGQFGKATKAISPLVGGGLSGLAKG